MFTKTIQLIIVLILGLSIAPFGAQAAHAAPSCDEAGSTGLTTLMTAKSGQIIAGKTIDATGCDVGIFVPPNSKNVIITRNEIFGANIHAIFVQDSNHILIDHNNVHDNSGGVPNVTCDRP